MKRTGRLTRNLFERYGIHSKSDSMTAVAKLAGYLEAQESRKLGTNGPNVSVAVGQQELSKSE